MRRTRASGLRAVAAVMVLFAMFPVFASAQWNGSGQATIDAFACGESRYVNGVFQQDFYLATTYTPTDQNPTYYATFSPVQINTGFYFSSTTPYVQSSYSGTVTLSYTAGSGFGYGNPPVGSTVHYFITGAIMDSSTGGAASQVSYREAFCAVPAPPAPTPEPTPTNTPEPTPTNTPEPTPTNTPEPTPTNTPEPTPTNTPEPTPTNTPEPTPTNTPEPTPTNTPEPTPTNTPEPTPTNTPEPTPTNTPEPTPTNTPEPTPTNTPEPTPTNTPEPTPTNTPEPTTTAEPGVTPSPTAEETATATSTVAPTATTETGVTPSPTVEETATATSTVAPTATSDPVLPPTETATVAPAQETISIQIAMPNGESIEGAPWDLYASSASQAGVQPYLSGVVGPNNTIKLVDLPHGQYRLVIRPAGMNPIELMLTADGESQNIVLQVPGAPTATGTTVQQTVAPTQATTSAVTAGPTVSALPSTGTGEASMMPMMVLITAGCIVTIMMSAFVLRRSGE